MRLYRYVGPHDLRALAGSGPPGAPIASPDDVEAWMAASRVRGNGVRESVFTYVVDDAGVLRLADRASEHVACAGGRSVQSAGELAIARASGDWSIEDITNQSTGYCPEPDSWPQVAAALDKIPLAHPGRFTAAYQFRRCPACGQINLIKDDDFTCAVCGSDLPITWNIDPEAAT